MLTIQGIEKIGDYAIFDVTGKLLHRHTASENKIAVDALVPGSYMLEFRDGKAAYHFKFIKD